MDDGEMGRPARHDRTARARRVPTALDTIERKGEAKTERIRGKRNCADCGAEIKVDYTGPADSLGATIARSRLASPRCESCIEVEDDDERAADEQRARLSTIEDRVRKSGLPSAWRTLTFDELMDHPLASHQATARELAGHWAREGGGLVLYGEVGRGKTLIAAAAAVQRCAISSVRFLSVAKLLMDLRMPFGAPEYERAQRKLDAGARVALVLDDLDKLRPTEHQLQPLYVAINSFIEARQPLLVTCNRDLDTLAGWMGETFGPPIASRLTGYCDVVEIKGPDWREQ